MAGSLERMREPAVVLGRMECFDIGSPPGML
jgi:hypothetical protein